MDPRESLGIRWRRHPRQRQSIVDDEASLDAVLREFDAGDPRKFPANWDVRVRGWQDRHFALFASPWNEGLLQVIGISGGESLRRALVGLCERPHLAKAAMDRYADYVEGLLVRALSKVKLDYAVLYEPIASNHAPVISPAMYECFALPALRRVVECLEGHGVEFRFMWSAGQVNSLIPLWLDAGINGLILNQAGQAGITYGALRREFGPELLFFGGVDWRSVVKGPETTDMFLEREVRPVLEEGGYIPHLDDTVRAYMPFDHFRHYRRRLDALVDEVLA
ncbi:MAG: uroporphyrinogen decarboxylase family protein [Candidatus Hydrogenedentes bacterium]|nr:uroporphyrinogen decarboxylase family protein [Candidatus Hydrogenedentota bacterium]